MTISSPILSSPRRPSVRPEKSPEKQTRMMTNANVRTFPVVPDPTLRRGRNNNKGRRAKFSTALAGNREGKKRGGERENDIEKNTRTPRRTRECAGLMIDVVEAVRARFTLAVLWCWSRDGPVATTTSVVVCRSLRVCDDDEVGEEEHRCAPFAAQHGGGLRSESERRRRGHVSEHLENRLMRRGGGGDGGRASRVDIWRPY